MVFIFSRRNSPKRYIHTSSVLCYTCTMGSNTLKALPCEHIMKNTANQVNIHRTSRSIRRKFGWTRSKYSNKYEQEGSWKPLSGGSYGKAWLAETELLTTQICDGSAERRWLAISFKNHPTYSGRTARNVLDTNPDAIKFLDSSQCFSWATTYMWHCLPWPAFPRNWSKRLPHAYFVSVWLLRACSELFLYMYIVKWLPWYEQVIPVISSRPEGVASGLPDITLYTYSKPLLG